jgi:hypothetical protein
LKLPFAHFLRAFAALAEIRIIAQLESEDAWLVGQL